MVKEDKNHLTSFNLFHSTFFIKFSKLSDFLNILASNDTAKLYKNVTLNNKKGSILQADFIDYDFQRKKYKVSMYTESEKVKIKLIK